MESAITKLYCIGSRNWLWHGWLYILKISRYNKLEDKLKRNQDSANFTKMFTKTEKSRPENNSNHSHSDFKIHETDSFEKSNY